MTGMLRSCALEPTLALTTTASSGFAKRAVEPADSLHSNTERQD